MATIDGTDVYKKPVEEVPPQSGLNEGGETRSIEKPDIPIQIPEQNRSPLKRPLSIPSPSPVDTKTRSSPAKRLRLQLDDRSATISAPSSQSNTIARNKNKYIYGNYNRYYGYRNKKDEEDVRVVAFRQHAELFADKEIFDIGCNYGAVTVAVAKDLGVKFITGVDIDKDLIGLARKQMGEIKRSGQNNNVAPGFPHNIAFRQCNYVLDDERLLEMEQAQFDTILCLSVTKWIHLNFGDAGLKLAFKRMFRQLRCGGHLVLEAQNWQSYKRRKKLTPVIWKHFQEIALFPNQFDAYLMSDEVGFKECFDMELPPHPVKGFQRPIRVFRKELQGDTKGTGEKMEEAVNNNASRD